MKTVPIGDREISLILDALVKEQDKVIALRKVIEEAPHDLDCSLVRRDSPCNCWKSEVPR